MRVSPGQVRATAELLQAGNTIPFIARYRKEATQNLAEQALRFIEDSLAKAQELAQRKATILRTIDQQGQLTDELRRQIETCQDKQQFEDLYLPFKPKRRTRATIARERGLEPLAEILLRQERLNRPRSEVLRPYVSAEREVPDEAAALAGACDIVAEHWSEDAATRSWLVKQAAEFGQVVSKARRGKDDPASKFAMYFDHQEPLKRMPSHRLLAMQRGEAEEVLRVSLQLDDELVLRKLKPQWVTNPQFEFHQDLLQTAEDCYQRLLLPATESATLQAAKEKADEEAIAVFAKNLRELLLAPPAGAARHHRHRPGLSHGVQSGGRRRHGQVPGPTTIYPTPPHNDVAGAARTLLELIAKFDAKLIAIGNGTASRETDAFVTDTLRTAGCRSPRSWSASRGRRSTRPAKPRPASTPTWTSRCAAPSASRIGCRTRWPNWSRSTRNRLASASTSTT